jgi:hypothetical protein
MPLGHALGMLNALGHLAIIKIMQINQVIFEIDTHKK